ncbi:MAG: hypothetical protein QOK23_4615 [Gammaproteobacteria bacterium]|jgi:hypothetical protein|nr:hypothetical protein [Gammaproteobacteria bacterium]
MKCRIPEIPWRDYPRISPGCSTLPLKTSARTEIQGVPDLSLSATRVTGSTEIADVQQASKVRSAHHR